eukprot:2919964-Rhodomonas_salina.2
MGPEMPPSGQEKRRSSRIFWITDRSERKRCRKNVHGGNLVNMNRRSLATVCLVAMMATKCANGLHFRMPKEGKHYDTSEAVFWFEVEPNSR